MSKDPAFLFYPGDYLRDTQCLSSSAQVAYDRIMCEHMRSIPIAKDRVHFFTKRLNEDEKAELLSVLEQYDGGFVIGWLVVSIEKRKAYSESRRKNGEKKYSLHMQSIRPAQENEIENVNDNVNNKDKGGVGGKERRHLKYVKDAPPSLDDVKAYCIERKNGIDAQAFLDRNQSIGWMDKNGNLYQDWKAVIRNWENWNKKTTIRPAPKQANRPVSLVVIEMVAAGHKDQDIRAELDGKYTEHEITEALMSIRGDIR